MKTRHVRKKTARERGEYEFGVNAVRVPAARRGNRKAEPGMETRTAEDRQIDEIERTFTLRYEW